LSSGGKILKHGNTTGTDGVPAEASKINPPLQIRNVTSTFLKDPGSRESSNRGEVWLSGEAS